MHNTFILPSPGLCRGFAVVTVTADEAALKKCNRLLGISSFTHAPFRVGIKTYDNCLWKGSRLRYVTKAMSILPIHTCVHSYIFSVEVAKEYFKDRLQKEKEAALALEQIESEKIENSQISCDVKTTTPSDEVSKDADNIKCNNPNAYRIKKAKDMYVKISSVPILSQGFQSYKKMKSSKDENGDIVLSCGSKILFDENSLEHIIMNVENTPSN